MKIELAKTEIIHFIGIGGIGMSGLALIMKRMGFNVQGSDVLSNKNIERLKKDKIKLAISHTKKNMKNYSYENTWNNINLKIISTINEN